MEKKPSWKSTAFIINVVGILITLLGAIQQYIPASTAAIISACLTAVFTIANAVTKLAPAAVDPSPQPSPTRGEGELPAVEVKP